MGTTPIFGFPYPDPSDLVANYPALGQQLAEDVEDAIYARKILQIVRATDSTNRTTTSTSFVDASISVTITPQANTSAILLIMTCVLNKTIANESARIQITDASNNAISGAQDGIMGTAITTDQNQAIVIIGYATPATTSATTFKGRFRSSAGNTVQISNGLQTGQLYAIEVSA
jgi:hypothetical protein